MEKKIDNFVRGNLEHAAETLSALWKTANKDGTVAAPSNSAFTVSLFSLVLFPVLRKGRLFRIISP